MQKKEISIEEAAHWVAKMAAKDGIITNNERRLMNEFADSFAINVYDLYNLADRFCQSAEQEVEPISINQIKGRRFEEFVVSLLSDKAKFKLLAWWSDKIYQNTYAVENLYPDLHIKHNLDTCAVEYFVECKYRSSWGQGKIDISSQFLRYRKYAKAHNIELFIALGVGGKPSAPDEFFIVPARMIGYSKCIEQDRFKPCRIQPIPADFDQYINNYYNKRIFSRQ